MESKQRKQCRFHKMGTVTTEATLDLGPSKLDIAKYRDIWFKTSFLLDQKQSKTEWRKRVLTIIKPSIKLYFSNTFHRKKPVIDASKPRLKAAIIRVKRK
jgi:phosphoribosylformylglycinamidine synthase